MAGSPFLHHYLQVGLTADQPADPETEALDAGSPPINTDILLFRLNTDGDLVYWNPSTNAYVVVLSAVEAADVAFDNVASGLTATDVQAAIDELDAAVDGLSGGSYTDSDAQDAVGAILVDGTTVNFTYVSATSLTAEVQALATTHFAANVVDTDGTLAANSDTRLATQKAVKTYVDANGGGAAWDLLGTASPSATGTVTFNSIPAGYSALKIIGMGRSTTAATGVAIVQLRLNNDSGANYHTQSIFANGSGTAGKGQGLGTTFLQAAEIPKDSDLADAPGYFELIIPFYDKTTYVKAMISHYTMFNANASSALFAIVHTDYWMNVAAVTRLDLILDSGNWKAGSEIRLYGIP